jgi:biopolymer transport protein ExbD
MTDVVFLLLIFFMIASTLAKQLNTIDVKLPQAEGKTRDTA